MSPVTTDMRRPSSVRKVNTKGLHSDWYENMTNIFVSIYSYISLTCVQMTVQQLIQRKLTKLLRCVIVSAILTTQRTHLPADHGTKVLLSGRLPSVLVNPVGSLTAGISTRQLARLKTSLIEACLECLPETNLHYRP